MKELFIEALILAYADFTLPLKVHTDASKDGLGIVPYQEHNEKERMFAYASRGLPHLKQITQPTNLKFLALKWAVTNMFCECLLGSIELFKVYKDNNPLTYILTMA